MATFYDPAFRVDLSSEQTHLPYLGELRKDGTRKKGFETDAHGKVVMRDPKTVRGVTLHQTACIFDVASYQLKASGGNAELARHRRLLGVPAHAVASITGKFVTHVPLAIYAWHAHGLNPFSLGLECEAMAPGLIHDPEHTTWGGHPIAIPDTLIKSARNAMGYLVEEGRAQGMPIEKLWAHRQSTNKPSDPGEQLWVEVGEWACKEFGLTPEYDLKMKDRNGLQGRTIPVEWAPGGVGHY